MTDDNTVGNQFDDSDQPMQSIDAIMQIISEATIPPVRSKTLNHYMPENGEMDDDMEDLGSESDLDIDSSGEIIYAM